MTTRSAPFESWRRLPADLVMGLYLVLYALAGLAWDEACRWRLVLRPLISSTSASRLEEGS